MTPFRWIPDSYLLFCRHQWGFETDRQKAFRRNPSRARRDQLPLERSWQSWTSLGAGEEESLPLGHLCHLTYKGVGLPALRKREVLWLSGFSSCGQREVHLANVHKTSKLAGKVIVSWEKNNDVCYVFVWTWGFLLWFFPKSIQELAVFIYCWGLLFPALNSFIEIFVNFFWPTCFKFLLLSKKADGAKLHPSYIGVTGPCSKDCTVGRCHLNL